MQCSPPVLIYYRPGLSKSKWSAARSQYILKALKLACSKKNLHKTLHYWSRDRLNFDISGKGLGIVSPLHFVHDSSRKMFKCLWSYIYSINWPNFVIWLHLLLEIPNNMSIVIVVIQFVTSETLKSHWVFYQVFLFLSCFPTWSKSQNKNLNISRTEVKSIFHHFKGLPVTWRNLQEIIIL